MEQPGARGFEGLARGFEGLTGTITEPDGREWPLIERHDELWRHLEEERRRLQADNLAELERQNGKLLKHLPATTRPGASMEDHPGTQEEEGD